MFTVHMKFMPKNNCNHCTTQRLRRNGFHIQLIPTFYPNKIIGYNV